MCRSRLFRFAALALLPVLSRAGAAQAATYDLAADWLTAFPTTASVTSATSSSFGAGNAWTAGMLSSNWVNQATTTANLETPLNYWNPSNGNLTSGTNGGTVTGTTGSYTVPFQFYAATPGITQQVNVGLTLAEQQLSGQVPFEVSSPTSAIKNPTGSTDNVSGGQGYMSYTMSTAEVQGASNVRGFSNNAQFATANPGNGNIHEATGIFYNYSNTAANTPTEINNVGAIAPSLANDVLDTWSSFGPWAVQWTAPTAGTVLINTTATDTNFGYFNPGDYVLAAAAGQTTAPTVLMSALNFNSYGSGSIGMTGNYYDGPSGIAGAPNGVNIVNGTEAVTGFGDPNGPYGQYWQGGSTNPYEYQSVSWASGAISVTAGEQLYFVTDVGHVQIGDHGNYGWGGTSDPGTIQAMINFTAVPEPSSVVLLSSAGIGLGLVAWKRRRRAPDAPGVN